MTQGNGGEMLSGAPSDLLNRPPRRREYRLETRVRAKGREARLVTQHHRIDRRRFVDQTREFREEALRRTGIREDKQPARLPADEQRASQRAAEHGILVC